MHIRGLHSAEGHCYVQYSQLYSASFESTNWIDNHFTTIFCSHMMLTNGSPLKPTNMSPTGGLFGSQPHWENNVGASDNNAGNTPSKVTHFGQPPIQIHPPPGYRYPHSQPPFRGAPQFYHPAASIMTQSLQLSSGATQEYLSYGPSWQGYNFPVEVMVDLECSPLSISQDRGCHLQVHLVCLQHPLETFQSFSRQLLPLLHMDKFPAQLGDPPSVSQRYHFSRLWNRAGQMSPGLGICPHCQRFGMTNMMQSMRAMICRTWVGPMAKPQSAWNKWNFPWSNLPNGWASPNFSTFNKWKIVWVAGFLGKKHRSLILGQKHLKQLHDGHLHRETAV